MQQISTVDEDPCCQDASVSRWLPWQWLEWKKKKKVGWEDNIGTKVPNSSLRE